MNVLAELPWIVRAAAAGVLGAIIGSLAQWVAIGLSFEGKPLSPWLPSHPRDDDDSLADRLPIVGWWRLRRKGKLLGYEFWVRPFVIDTTMALLMAILYVWEIESQRLPHAMFAAHALLVGFMLTASLIDLAEQIIPDEITVPGTLVGLAWLGAFPHAALPDFLINGKPIGPLSLASPQPWPVELIGKPNIWSLVLGLVCVWGACLALMPRQWRGRHGWRRAIALILTRIRRQRVTYFLLGLGLIVSAGVTLAWIGGGQRWQTVLSSLVGMAAGGAIIWAIRLIAGWTLGREAMGFGDVTLLAMIGVYLGWQAALFTFFLAPFAGLIFGVVQFMLRRDNVLPYGPFLCLAALFVIFRWTSLWEQMMRMFEVGWLVPAALGVCVLAVGVLLAIMQVIKRVLRR